MKRFRLITILIALLIGANIGLNADAAAYDFEIDGIYYKITSFTELTCEVVSSPSEYSGDIIIPETVTYKGKKLTVTKVNFRECNNLISVEISNTVTSLAEYCFMDCHKLIRVKLPESLTALPQFCFSDCNSLQIVNIPNAIKIIPEGCFSKCRSLENIIIPDNVNSLVDFAFFDCSSLKSFNMPQSSSIGAGCFSGCKSLKKINIQSYCDIQAFMNCVSLEKVEWNTPSKIPESCFNGCERLKNIEFANGCPYIGKNAFRGCKALETFNMPNSVKEIGEGCFKECYNLKTINLSTNLKTIPYEAFENCRAITEFSFPGSLEIIYMGVAANFLNDSFNKVQFKHCRPISLKFLYNKDNKSNKYGETPAPVVKYHYGGELHRSSWYITMAQSELENKPTKNRWTSEVKYLYLDKYVDVYEMTSLEELHLGPNINRVPSFVLSSKFKTIISENATPPTLNEETFTTSHYTDVIVKVPIEALNAYKSAPVWENFWNIEGVAGMSTISDDQEIHEIQRIDMNGLPVDELHKGLVIVRYSDGSSRKLLQK